MNKPLTFFVIFLAVFLGGIFAIRAVMQRLPGDSKTSSLTPSRQKQRTPYTGPAVTHTWYSSLFFDQWSYPLYAMPLSFRFAKSGVEIGLPQVSFSKTTIHAPHVIDLTLSLASGNVKEKSIVAPGEWDVSVRIANDAGDTALLHIIKGSPALYVSVEKGTAKLGGALGDVSKEADGTTLFTVQGKRYALIDQSGSVAVEKQQVLLAAADKPYALVALPDIAADKMVDTLAKLTSCARNEPTETMYTLEEGKKGTARITLSFGDERKTEYLTTLWPHSNGIIAQSFASSLGTYQTLRGKLTAVCASTLAFDIPTSPLPQSWADVLNIPENKQQAQRWLKEDIRRFSVRAVPPGVYFKGKYLKDLTDLWELAGMLGMIDEQSKLADTLRARVVEELDAFTADTSTGLVTHRKPEFGNEKGNDHHFQYSYYLYVFAKAYDLLPEDDQTRVDRLVNAMIAEGMPLVMKTIYPRLSRFFDPFEFHSWADAQALFADGNDEESTSEAMFYWYSLAMWGRKLSNTQLTTWATALFFAEKQGRDAYWLYEKEPEMLKRFGRPLVSLLWGGKVDYSTWFSAEADKILGIQILPIFPGSTVSLKFPHAQFALSKTSSFYPYFLFLKAITTGKKDPFVETEEFVPRTLYELLP